jgi:hypothetical protein
LSPTPKSLANLRPCTKGEVRNPEGRNQFTYRAEAEKHLDEWCKLSGRDLVNKICDEAKAGKPWAAKLMLDRILPAVQRHEVEIPEPAGIEELLSRVDHERAKRRGNGDARGDDPERANGGNGGAP